MPAAVARTSAEVAGALAGRATQPRRAMIARHLQRITGGPVSAATIDRAFASYGRYWMESFRLPAVTAEQLLAGTQEEGLEHVHAAHALGRGVVMAMPHLGGWDWGGAWLRAVGFPLSVVAEALEPPELFEWFTAWRRRLGMEVIPLGRNAGAEVMAALRRGDVVGLLCDRDLTGDGVEVEFFGERTTLPGGPALMALRTGAPLLPCAMLFEGDHHRAVVLPPLDTQRRATLREDLARVTQDLAHALAGLIARAPEQWHVFQPNWPSDRSR